MTFSDGTPIDEKKMHHDAEDLGKMPSAAAGTTQQIVAHDAVFGDIEEGGPNYRNVGWLGSSVLMMKIQIGLGVLAIPAAFDMLGLIPGLILLIVVGVFITWAGWVVGTFKLNHPSVYTIADAAFIVLGPIGREVFGLIFCIFWMFGAAGGMLGIAIGFNAITTHGACTAIFVAIAAGLGFGFASIRTLGRLTWIAWVGLIFLIAAIFTLTISVAVQDRPDAAPQEGDWSSDYVLFNQPSFTQAMNAISIFLNAFGAVPAFFPIVSEMRDPKRYTRSLLFSHGVVAALYILVGCVVYYYCGSFVSSPALGSAGKLMKKVCYGLSLPGLTVTTVLTIHFAAKYIFLRILGGSDHVNKNTVKHWVTWLGCTFGCSCIAYIIASTIPSFGTLSSLIGAAFSTILCVIPYGVMWLFDNWPQRKSATWISGWTWHAVWSVFVSLAGVVVMIGGIWGSALDIHAAYSQPGANGPFTCADNSNS